MSKLLVNVIYIIFFVKVNFFGVKNINLVGLLFVIVLFIKKEYNLIVIWWINKFC